MVKVIVLLVSTVITTQLPRFMDSTLEFVLITIIYAFHADFAYRITP